MKFKFITLLCLATFSFGVQAGVEEILASGDPDIVEKICDTTHSDVAKASDAIVKVAKIQTNLLRPVMECIYWRVEPEQFDAIVSKAVATLNAEGE
tara:strand:- start:346 stop:633 length:288 start_codon:yes stop_codon:yes gene_type:complete